MVYVKFLDSKALVPCEVIPNGNIVTLKFKDAIIVDKSGFQVFLDQNGEYCISGSYYHGYNTVYRNDEETALYNGYQLSCDGSVWTEPVTEEDSEPELTDEELAEIERQNKISDIGAQISSLKAQISDTDYQIIKTYEYSLVGLESEYDIASLHQERQQLRDKINELSEQLVAISSDLEQ